MSNLKEFFKGIKRGQKLFGEEIASIINFILLTLVYILGIGLTSIFAKVFRKKFLNPENQEDTYWLDLNLGKKQKEEYYRQF